MNASYSRDHCFDWCGRFLSPCRLVRPLLQLPHAFRASRGLEDRNGSFVDHKQEKRGFFFQETVGYGRVIGSAV